MVGGKLDFFVPVFQNLDSLAFLNLGVGTETKANVLYNIGVGYRTKIDPDWIVGVYAGHDGTQLDDNNTFGQESFSGELMSADWDVRLNGYLADNAPKAVPGQFGLFISGTTIGILQGEDVGYSGFDGEVGYRVFSTDDTDVRVFIGGFHFSRDPADRMSTGVPFDFTYRDLSGPKARAEATVYDLDIIGNQSRLTVDGQIEHDDVRGTTGSFGVTLRIPLGSYSGSSGAQALDELDRRMTDPVRHNDQVLTRSQFTKPEPVIIYGPHVTSQPTNTLLYVSSTATTGVGTYANPTTLADATGRPTTNAFIVLSSKGGPIPGGATLQAGQTLVAGGETFTVEGEFSHTKFTHLFDPSTNVTLIPATPGGNVLNLANNTSLYGFTIEGDFGNAIYGKNVDHVNISGITIDGTGGGRTGIDIRHTVSGEENITIQNVAISNITEDGIDLRSSISDGGTSTETFKLSNVAVSNAGGYGILINDYAYGGSKITSGITMSNVAISNVGYAGISVGADAYGTGSSVNQTVAASNIAIANTAADGVDLQLFADYGGHVTSNASFSNVAVSGVPYVGFSSYAIADGAGAAINQTLSLSNAAVSGAGYAGVTINAFAGTGTSINQTVSLTNVAVSNSGASNFFGQGIALSASAFGAGAYVNQTATITDSSASYIAGSFASEGFSILADARDGAAVVQSVSINSSSADHNGIGLYVRASAYDYGHGQTTVDQKVTVSGTAASPVSFSNNSDDGVVVVAYAGSGGNTGYASQAAVSQSLTISNAVIDHNFIGVAAEVDVAQGASVTQNLYISNADISHNTRYGVVIDSYAQTVGFAGQNVTITGSSSAYSNISNNGADGVFIQADA